MICEFCYNVTGRMLYRGQLDVFLGRNFVSGLLCTLKVALVVALVERWTRDRKVQGSAPGRGAIKSTRSTQPSIPPG